MLNVPEAITTASPQAMPAAAPAPCGPGKSADSPTIIWPPIRSVPPSGTDTVVCKDVCVTASQGVEAKLNIGSEYKASADASTIGSWISKVPMPLPPGRNGWDPAAWWEKSTNGDIRPILIDCHLPTSTQPRIVDSADFYPYASDQFEVQAASEMLKAANEKFQGFNGFTLRKFVKKYSGDWPKEISGIVTMEVRGIGHEDFEVFKLPIDDKSPIESLEEFDAHLLLEQNAGSQPFQRSEMPMLPSQPLWQMLLYAFIGGLILNIMPCVLPVIALKILGFVSEARSEPRRVRNLGLIYALGVLVSFLALAAIVIGVKAAGHHAGWGMQFGSPIFIVCLTTLVSLVALNLFGRCFLGWRRFRWGLGCWQGLCFEE